jgi:hypothetical protein
MFAPFQVYFAGGWRLRSARSRPFVGSGTSIALVGSSNPIHSPGSATRVGHLEARRP